MFMLRSNIFGLRKMLINCDSIGSGGRGGEQAQGLSWVSCLFVFWAFVGCFDLVPLIPLPTLSDASAGRHLPNVPHAAAPSPYASCLLQAPTRLYILFKAGCYMRGKNNSTRSRGRIWERRQTLSFKWTFYGMFHAARHNLIWKVSEPEHDK